MTVLHIVATIATSSIEQVKQFYQTLFDMDVVMDHGWIVTLSSAKQLPPK